MIKELIKVVLPQNLYNSIKSNKNKFSVLRSLIKGYVYDFKLYYSFSDTKESDTSIKLIGKIIKKYHIIEKGLTMPKSRLGFGKDIIVALCENCEEYIKNYGKQDEQLQHAIGVLDEYKDFHIHNNYYLDKDVISLITKLCNNFSNETYLKQKTTTKNEYFKYVNSGFHLFANSRSSIRNYSNEEISTENIINALELSRSTPSACNRQTWRTYLFSNKEQIKSILEIQGGNRGFGHLTNKLIVIASELGVFGGVEERNQVYIDGGIYAMNLLYALHYYQIGTCILNCCHSPQKDKLLRKLCKLKRSEVFIAMISCGIPPTEFKIATSYRYDLTNTNKIIP